MQCLVCTGSHRAIARKAKEPKQIHDILGLSRERLTEIQSQVDTFVTRGLELLQIERDAELEATHQSLEGAASAIGISPLPSSTIPEVGKDEQALENCDSITNLIATGSTTGISSNVVVCYCLFFFWRHKRLRYCLIQINAHFLPSRRLLLCLDFFSLALNISIVFFSIFHIIMHIELLRFILPVAFERLQCANFL